jgi:hypothetical protein
MYDNQAVSNLEDQIFLLPAQQQLDLIKKIAQRLSENTFQSGEKKSMKDLFGSGKGLWDNLDAQEYINQLREDRI